MALAGCGRSTNKKQITFWGAGREGDIAAELIRGFEQEYPEISVNVQKMPFTVAHEKLLTAYAGDTLPDLCQLGNTWIPEFAALDALEPLDSYVAGSQEVQLDDYFEGILASNRVDKTLFGIPWYVDTRLLYYRRDLLKQAGFDEPPQSWQQWSEMLGAIKQLVGPDRYSVLLPLNEFEPLLVLSLQLPAELLRDGGRYGNFRGPDFRKALSFYNSLFERGWAPRMTNTQISQRLGRVWTRVLLVLHLGALEHRRVQATPAAGRAERMDDGDHAGAGGAGAVQRRWLQSGHIQDVAGET